MSWSGVSLQHRELAYAFRIEGVVQWNSSSWLHSWQIEDTAGNYLDGNTSGIVIESGDEVTAYDLCVQHAESVAADMRAMAADNRVTDTVVLSFVAVPSGLTVGLVVLGTAAVLLGPGTLTAAVVTSVLSGTVVGAAGVAPVIAGLTETAALREADAVLEHGIEACMETYLDAGVGSGAGAGEGGDGGDSGADAIGIVIIDDCEEQVIQETDPETGECSEVTQECEVDEEGDCLCEEVSREPCEEE